MDLAVTLRKIEEEEEALTAASTEKLPAALMSRTNSCVHSEISAIAMTMATAAVPPTTTTTTTRDDDGEALGVAASSISVVAIASSPKEEGLYSRSNNHSLHNEDDDDDDDTASLSTSRRSNKRQMNVDTNYAVTKKRLLLIRLCLSMREVPSPQGSTVVIMERYCLDIVHAVPPTWFHWERINYRLL